MSLRPSVFDCDVLALDVAELRKPATEGDQEGPIRRYRTEKSDHGHRRLLRARREWPRRRAAERRDERPAVHSITSSARASSVGGTSRPSTLAVFRLITSSYL